MTVPLNDWQLKLPRKVIYACPAFGNRDMPFWIGVLFQLHSKHKEYILNMK